MLGDESVVAEARICPTHSIDFLGLSRRELLMRVETPRACQQALPSEHLVNARDASAERVRDVEDRAVRVSEGRGLGEPSRVEYAGGALSLHALEQLHRRPRPASPLAEQTTVDPTHRRLAADRHGARGQQVDDDAVVIARVERDVVAPGVRNGADNVDRLISVERRDLDRPHVRHLGELAPERVAEHAAADGWLQVEAEERHHLAHFTTMQQQLALILTLPIAKAEQAYVVA